LDRLLQQRLLGAAILLAVLVIVVPELLDGAGHRSRYPSSVDIPEAPVFKPMPAVESLPIVQPDISAQPVPEASVASATTDTAIPPPAEPVVEKPVAVESAKKPVTTSQKPAGSIKPAWALQVGSFSEKNNALKMRDEFRARGYTAYVDEDKGSFRVRIGPELDRARLEKLQDKIYKQEKIKGMIVIK
jgi:DedD protein